MRRKELGDKGEGRAARYFEELGYKILERNRRSRTGEIDLILMDGDTLVFCEVKTRSSRHSGHAAESYGMKQQQRIRRSILAYLQKSHWEGALRVDLLALQRAKHGPSYEVHHFKDALSLEDNW